FGSSHSTNDAKSPTLSESHKSARNVLENIGIKIYNQEIKKKNPYEQQLKGTLSRAQFVDALSSRYIEGRNSDGNSCNLDHLFHTNIKTGYNEGRKPCYGREQNRFDENAEAYCNSDKIRGNENNANGAACAPPRRRHICDQNLEFLDNKNTNTAHDLLGNVLVTAKYEGNYIVNDHPDKNSNGNKAGICTSLARSFADIGDIVRGRDMFLPNKDDKVQKGLQVVFKKIYKSLTPEARKHYAHGDGSGNYAKLREDWWTINREQIWKALTCSAPYYADYFRKGSDGTLHFSSHGKCGHNEGAPPTYLDYVPQFLRWFEEWSEEFCRIKKIKIDKVKKECRDEQNKKYCSGDGHDCTQTNLAHNQIFVDLDCPRCQDQCIKYNEWIVKKLEEFYKQNLKYSMEIQKWKKTKNNYYDKEFYENLDKKSYSTIDKFLNLLNNGKHCHDNKDEKNKIDFNKPIKTFSISEYCKTCPLYGVTCTNRGICIHNS
uniref:ERYTHROCYTE MEMBRANE PROTEIN 1 n=1 Tax=Plasmodium falciparum (isolate Palo Alto / Uganda) TaxID=57270 RepID=UPI000204532F|nr:Chain A, ERYTHROCYTE MEMBRANE PROTEIN 1 [Plasmodium falciparum Palo Alto/Uganda]